MNLTIQHLLFLGITAQEGISLAAAYHWSVQQITYMDNINAAREDRDRVTQLLKGSMAAAGLQEAKHEDQIIEDIYVELLKSYKDRLEVAVAGLPQLQQYESLSNKNGQLTYEEILNTLDRQLYIVLHNPRINKEDDQVTTNDALRKNQCDQGDRMEDDTGAGTAMAVQGEGNNTATTTTTYLPHAIEGTDDIGNEQGNTSRTTTTQEKTTSSIDTITSLADLSPETEVYFQVVK